MPENEPPPLVEIARGAFVPAEFTDRNPIAGGRCYVEVVINVDPGDREVRVENYMVSFDPPARLSEITDPAITAWARHAVVRRAGDEVMNRVAREAGWATTRSGLNLIEPGLGDSAPPSWPLVDEADIADAQRAALAAMNRHRGRPRVTEDAKREIYDFWQKNGIHKTTEKFNLTERTIRRHIADIKRREGAPDGLD